MKFTNKALTLLASILAAGCSTPTTVTFYSEVSGATLIEQGSSNRWEGIPYTIPYNWNARYVNKSGCLQIKGMIARWPSGHTIKTPEMITLCGSPGAYNYKIPYSGSAQQRSIDVPYGENLIAERQREKEQSGYLMGVAIGGALAAYGNYEYTKKSAGVKHQSQPVVPYRASTPSYSQDNSCTSDFDCESNKKCIKAPMSNSGMCLAPTNQFNQPNTKPIQRSWDSIMPNMNIEGQCRIELDCKYGYRCDEKLKVCIKK